MSLSFEDSLKNITMNNMATTKNENIVAPAIMSVEDMSLDSPSIMTLDESYAMAAYSGDDGNWIEDTKYPCYKDKKHNNRLVFSDENVSLVSDKKEIALKDGQINITQEANSQYIPFEMSRYYDGFDLTEADISIHYERSDGEHNFSIPINVSYNDDKIRFGWLVDGYATSYAGKLKFEIHAYGTVPDSDNNGTREPLSYVWKTKTNESLNVLQSLCSHIEEEEYNKIDETWMQDLVERVAYGVAEQIANAQVGAQVNEAKAAAAEAKAAADVATNAATTAVTNALGDYSTTTQMEAYVTEQITNADIEGKLTKYAKTEDVKTLVGDIGESETVVDYVSSTVENALSAKMGNLVDDGNNPLTVEAYVNKKVEEVDVSDQIGDLGDDDEGNPIATVVAYVDKKVGEVDVSEQLNDYYKKAETYSKDEIDTALDNVSVDLTDYATETYVNNKVSQSETSINTTIAAIRTEIESIDKSPNAQYITTYNQPFTFEGEEYTGENMLVLYEIYNKDKENEIRTVVSSHEIKGGSGVPVSNSEAKRITPTPFIERLGNKVVLYYNFTNEDTGIGYATWKIGNRTVINKKTIYNGENFEDLTDYIGVGNDQKVSLIITDDSNTILPPIVWYVSIVDIKLMSDFGDTTYYPAGSPVDFTFTPSGAVDKTIHILLDGKEIGTKISVKSASDLLDSYPIPAQEHGSHLIEAYVTAKINGVSIGEDRSIYVAKGIVWFDSESDIPVIGCATPIIDTLQYNTVKIKYTVFDKNTETPEVTWYVNDIAMSTEVLTEKDEDGYYIKPYKANDVGTFELKVTCGEAEPKIITLNVEKLNIDIAPVTTGLAFDFNPSGCSNSSPDRLWTNGIVSMSVSDNFDWVNGGYQYDENGDQYFCVKSGTTATINYNLFADDAKTQGKEFKVAFKTSNIKNRDTTFISCINSGIGLDMKVQDANIYSSNGSLYSPYCEEDIIEFEFNINTIDNIPLVMTYEDGVGCRPMIYASDASFWQTTPQPITIGSSDCDVHIYRMKAYARSLSDSEILSNFILDAKNANEIADRFNRNKIYESIDENGKKISSIKGTLTPEGLAEACPDLRIIIVDAPWFTNDKDNKVDDTTVTMIYKNGRPEDNWTCTGAQHSGQGTSSNEYGYAGRNLDLIMDGDTSIFKWTDENGDEIESKTITLTETSVPTDYLNVKVNIASSENQNNAQMARRYNEYNPFKRSAKFNDSKVKDCMEFYNCVVFVRENNTDISTHREFGDCEYHFYAIGNVGDSKKTDDTRVNDKNDPKECVVEITDYNVPLAEFPTGNGRNICNPSDWKEGNSAYDLLYAEYQYKDGKFKSFGSKSYEFRYEMKGITEEQRETNINAWRDMYKFVVTSTNEEFYSRLKEYFVIDSALYYYLFTERYTMVDNRAKNSFWHFGKVYITEEEAVALGDAAGGFIIDNAQAAINSGYRWDLSFGYDFDTSLGIDNTGKLVLTYGKEDTDYYVDEDPSSSYIYRAAESTFFCRLRDLFKSELQVMFVDRENKNAWSANHLITQWDNAQNQFPEELWRLDIQRKYLRTYLGTSIDNSIAGAKGTNFLPNMMNGRKRYQRRMFERNQELYMATKYFGTVATQDQIRIRFNNPESYVLKPDFTLYITPYSDMYIGYSFYNGHRDNFKAKAGVEYTVNYPKGLETADITLIYGASFIQAIGDLSKCYAGADTDFSKATRLQSLIIGSNVEGYSNSYMDKIPLTNNKLLEYLDIRNVTGLKGTLDLSKCGNLLELRAEGSSAKGVIFANGGKIEKFYLPAITSLTAKNLNYLEDFDIEGYNNLQTLVVENTPVIDTHEIVDTTLEVQSSLPNDAAKLNVLRLIGIDWNIDNADILDDVILLRGQNSDGGEILQSVLAGKVHVPTIGQHDLDKYQEAWKDLTIVPRDGIIPQYKVTFVNYDGATLLRADGTPEIQYIDQYGSAVNPITREDNPIATPTKESTAQYSYTFAGWDKAFTNVQENIIVTATYNEEVRKYTIQYKSMGNSIKTYENVPYGSNAVYDGETPKYTLAEPTTYRLFKGWDKSGIADGDFDENGIKVIDAVWDTFTSAQGFKYADGTPKKLEDLSPVEVYALIDLSKRGQINIGSNEGQESGTYAGFIADGDRYSFALGHDFNYDDVPSVEIIGENSELGDEYKSVVEFNGTNYLDTGIQLFDEDKDFVLAIDYEFTGNTVNSVLAQCCRVRTNGGFQLLYNNGARLKWTSNVTTTPIANVNEREMVVIRHKKGEPTLTVYSSNLNEPNIYSGTLDGTEFTVTDADTLVFGCEKQSSTVFANYASGKVHWAKIWYKDIGDKACQELASWIHEDIDFQACGFNRYYISNTTDDTTSSFSLLATHLLERTKRWNPSKSGTTSGTGNIGGWAESELNGFLNTRLYNALPIQIKSLIKQVEIASSVGSSSNSISTSNCYITIPSVIELDSSMNSAPFDSEGKHISYINTSNDRCRTFRDEETGRAYWTRSPYLYSSPTHTSASSYVYYVSDSGTLQSIGQVSNPYGVLIEISF